VTLALILILVGVVILWAHVYHRAYRAGFRDSHSICHGGRERAWDGSRWTTEAKCSPYSCTCAQIERDWSVR
jgi:hypothetical protein